MSNRRLFLATVMVGAVGFLGSGAVMAAESAKEFAERTSVELVQIIEKSQSYSETDPEKLHVEIGELLDRVVDFPGFARGVMGKKYRGAATKKQNSDFTVVLREVLVSAFSRILIGFGPMKIDVLSATGTSKNTTVKMVAKSVKSGKAVDVLYSMAEKTPGEWKVRNVVIEGVNLGVTYKNQFADSMGKNNGDMDAVIASWAEEAEPAQ